MENLSIVIPAYNEELRIGKTLEVITSYLDRKNCGYEIIVVDDGSTDKTVKVAQNFRDEKIKILKNSKNKGKGYSVKQGVLNAKKNLILMTDADLSTPIEELENLLKYPNYDILIGSRALKNSNIIIHQPRLRELGGKAINLLVQLFLLPGIKDTQCGFKLFKRSAADKIFPKQTINRWGFDFEVLFIAKKSGFKIKEIPVTWRNDIHTTVKPVRDGLRLIFDLVKIRLNNIKGLYN